jgi:hypothetical protein
MTNRFLAHRGRRLVALTVAVTAAALLAAVASAQGPAPDTPAAPLPIGTSSASVVGAGTTTLGAGFPAAFRDDRILVMVTARMLPDASVQGTFAITHREPDGAVFADLRGEIRCLAVQGDQAVLTGTITVAHTPGLPNSDVKAGMLAAIVVHDGGTSDRMAWTFGNPDQVPNCAALPAVAVASVEQGSFVVRE